MNIDDPLLECLYIKRYLLVSLYQEVSVRVSLYQEVFVRVSLYQEVFEIYLHKGMFSDSFVQNVRYFLIGSESLLSLLPLTPYTGKFLQGMANIKY